MKYKRVEMLVFTASKEIRNGEICVIGQGIPMAAGAIAKKKHAPQALILTEAGMVDIDIFQNLEDVGDPGCTIGYSYSLDLYDVFTTIVNRGYADVCMLGAAQIDKFGNINTTIIGEYKAFNRKSVRLPGSGGANEFAGYCKRTVYTLVGGEFVEKLDYFTTAGWLTGNDSRQKAGLIGGPSTVVSQQGVFRFDEVTKEMYLAGLFPQTTLDDVRKEVPWNLKTAEDFGKEFEKLDVPTIEDLKFLREFEPFLGIGSNEGHRLQAQVLPVYFEGGRKNE